MLENQAQIPNHKFRCKYKLGSEFGTWDLEFLNLSHATKYHLHIFYDALVRFCTTSRQYPNYGNYQGSSLQKYHAHHRRTAQKFWSTIL